MISRKSALAWAKQYRTCPPPHIVDDAAHADAVAAHRKICPYCAAGVPTENLFWNRIADVFSKMKKRHGAADAAGQDVQAGCLCWIRSERAGWRKNLYYSPPLVLVLDADGPDPQAVQVAQTYHDRVLAGPGDLILAADQTGYEALFIETWNVYTLDKAVLEPPVGRIEDSITAAARAMSRLTSAAQTRDRQPPELPLPAPMTENDPRIHFRQLEVSAGFTFAYPAVHALMAAAAGTDSQPLPSTAQMKKAVLKANPGVYWKRRPTTPFEALMLARFTSEALPLAAADEGVDVAVGKYVILREGIPGTYAPVPVEIYKQAVEEDGLWVTGRVRLKKKVPAGTQVVCCLTSPKVAIKAADRFDWEADTGAFAAEFDGRGFENFSLVFAVIHEEEDD